MQLYQELLIRESRDCEWTALLVLSHSSRRQARGRRCKNLVDIFGFQFESPQKAPERPRIQGGFCQQKRTTETQTLKWGREGKTKDRKPTDKLSKTPETTETQGPCLGLRGFCINALTVYSARRRTRRSENEQHSFGDSCFQDRRKDQRITRTGQVWQLQA